METYRDRGRSLVGVSGADPTDMPQTVETIAAVLAAVADGAPLDVMPSPGLDTTWTHPMPLVIRHMTEDLRFYYQEAIAAQPPLDEQEGVAPSHHALNDWIYKQTVLGETILAIGQRLADSDLPGTMFMRGLMIPEGYWPHGTSWGHDPESVSLRDHAAGNLAHLARDDYAGARTRSPG